MHSEQVDTREKNTRNTRDTKKGPKLRVQRRRERVFGGSSTGTLYLLCVIYLSHTCGCYV